MFTKEAIEAIQHASGTIHANGAITEALGSTQVAAMPNHFALHDLERYMPTRRRARGVMETTCVGDFATYCKTHAEAGAAVFLSQKLMAATAVLNLGGAAEPGHADNLAKFTPLRTAAYSALRAAANGASLTQARAAEFLEDWVHMIACSRDGESIPTAHAISAIRCITIESARSVEASDQQLSATKSAFESVKASSKNTLPTLIRFACEPYHGMDDRTFTLRLGVLTGDKPSITLRIVNLEEIEEDMAFELRGRVIKATADHLPVFLGEYSRAN
jgi:uncharacterized protein YfdQ (DUF2303 family)